MPHGVLQPSVEALVWIVTHADGSFGGGVGFLAAIVCPCVHLSVCFSADISKSAVARIIKLDKENVPPWVLETHLFWESEG